MDSHLRCAIPPLLDELVAPLVRQEVVAALATEGDASTAGMALKGANSFAVAYRLVTNFSSNARISAPTLRKYTAPFSTFAHADSIGAAPGIDRMAPHSEGNSVYLLSNYGATGGPTENFPPELADTVSPRGTETAWSASPHKTESRISQEEGAHLALKTMLQMVQKLLRSRRLLPSP